MISRFAIAATVALLAATPLSLRAQAAVGELYSTVARVRGAVTLISGGTTVLSGSSIESGEQPANLVLRRGGSLTICQGTSVSVSSSANGHDLMFSFGSGTIESHYKIGAASDSIITPDFRFVVTGPGEFDLNIGITPAGDTCVRSRPESSGGVIVDEQMGDGSYQVKPSDFVVFRKGRVADPVVNPGGMSCGCPVPKATVVAKQAPPPALAIPALGPKPEATERPLPTTETAEPSRPSQPMTSNTAAQHMVVDTPFVFHADGSSPFLTTQVMRLRLEPNRYTELRPQVQAPGKKAAKKGFWHRFASIFR